MSEEVTSHSFWAEKCEQLWERFDDNERLAVRFGMVPHWAAQELESAWNRPLTKDESRLLTLGLIEEAKKYGSMYC